MNTFRTLKKYSGHWIRDLMLVLLAAMTLSGHSAQLVSPGSIYGDPLKELTFKVHYFSVDKDSISDGDIWVFGYGGYSSPAKLLSVEPLIDDLFLDPATIRISPKPGKPDALPEGLSYAAVYLIPLPSADNESWTKELNQRMALLLEPEQIKYLHGEYAREELLGYIHLKIGESQPPITPSDVELGIDRFRNTYRANLHIQFPEPEYTVLSWGEPVVDGNSIKVEVTFGEKPRDHWHIQPHVHQYIFPELAHGEYQFSVFAAGNEIASEKFIVDGLEFVPTKLKLIPTLDENGVALLKGTVTFLDPYFVVDELGTVQVVELETDEYRDGLEIRITAGRATFIRAPEIQDFPLSYTLPELGDGLYQLSVYVNNDLKFRSVVEIPVTKPGSRPLIQAFSASPSVVNPGEPVTLTWDVQGAESIVILPGVGEVTGNSVVVYPGVDDHLPLPLPPIIFDGPGHSPGEGAMAPVVSWGSEWKYSDAPMQPADNWTSPDFDDSQWKSGKAPLGYGDGDEATGISYGTDSENKNITAYFRHAFKWDASVTQEAPTPFFLIVHRDDGAVVYLNGREVGRTNMPSGDVDYSTTALTAADSDGDEDRFVLIIHPSDLVNGVNVLAVEVHQVRPDSSDLSFDLTLSRIPEIINPRPPIEYVQNYILSARNRFGSSSKEVEVVVKPREPSPSHKAQVTFFEDQNGHHARVVVDLLPGFQIVQWGELITESLTQESYSWKVELTIVPLGDETVPGPAPEPTENTYLLGKLRAGRFPSVFSVTDGKAVIGSGALMVHGSDSVVPGVTAKSGDIGDPKTAQHIITVTYALADGIDTNSLGGDDIRVVPQIEVDVPGLRVMTFPAQLKSFRLYDDEVTVEATYIVEFADGFFENIYNLQFEIILMDGAVKTRGGSQIAGGRIGSFSVMIPVVDPPPVHGQADAKPIQHPQDSTEIHISLHSVIPFIGSSLSDESLRIVRNGADGSRVSIAGALKLVEVSTDAAVPVISASFLLEAPPTGWTVTDNGVWAIEFVEGGALFEDGSAFPGMQLGLLVVALRDPDPMPGKLQVLLDEFRDAGEVGVDVSVTFAPNDRRQVTDWGSPVEMNGTIYLKASSTLRATLDALPLTQKHRYVLGTIPGNGEDVPFESMDGPAIDVVKPQNTVIQSQIEWNSWVSEQIGDVAIVFEPPVNLDQWTLIGVFSGEKPNPGYSIQVKKVTRTDAGILVHYEEHIPGVADFYPQVITYPSHWIAIKKSAGPFEFHGTQLALPDIAPPVATSLGHSMKKTVVFVLDGEPIARTSIILGDLVDQEPGDDMLVPSATEISVDVEDGVAFVSVGADFTGSGVPVQFVGWDDIDIDGSWIGINLKVKVGENPDGIPTPGAPPIFNETFTFENLKPAHYQVVLKVNGVPVARSFFLIKGNHPFFNWLEDHIRGMEKEETPGRSAIIHQNDADGDGLSDYYEWAFVTDPVKPGGKAPIRPHLIQRDGKKHFSFDFDYQSSSSDVEYIIEGSDNLVFWFPLETSCTVLAQSTNQDGSSHMSLCLDQAIDDLPARFVRIRVTEDQD